MPKRRNRVGAYELGAIKHSPWGSVQHEERIAPGITFVSTASHGGFKLNEDLNEKIPASMRQQDGWYEEDVDWAIIPIIYPDAFRNDQRARAITTLKNWRPQLYERFFEERLSPGESYIKDEQIFRREHKDDYIGMSAYGSWKAGVPPGFVGVFAGRGGRTAQGRFPEDTAWFLVPENEYDERSPFGFVIDENQHQRISPLD
jgi:hypothetical protein